jgi:hypothetical protein
VVKFRHGLKGDYFSKSAFIKLFCPVSSNKFMMVETSRPRNFERFLINHAALCFKISVSAIS